MSYELRIVCDATDDPGARDPKTRCASRDNASIVAEATDLDTLAAKARTAARDADWSRIRLNNSGRQGFICPPCRNRRG